MIIGLDGGVPVVQGVLNKKGKSCPRNERKNFDQIELRDGELSMKVNASECE